MATETTGSGMNLLTLSLIHCPPRAPVPAPPTNEERRAAMRVVMTHKDHLFNTVFAPRKDAHAPPVAAPKRAPQADRLEAAGPVGR